MEPQDQSTTSKSPFMTGSCACSAIQWTSNTAPEYMNFCHCSQCRKISGAPFLPFLTLDLAAVTFQPALDSPSSTIKYARLSKNADRGFCSDCGSPILMQYHAKPGTVYLMAGSLNEESVQGGVKSLKENGRNKHIYVKDKAGWYDLPHDSLPRHEDMPSARDLLVYGD